MDIYITCRVGSSRLKDKYKRKLIEEKSLDFLINRAIDFRYQNSFIKNIIITTGPKKRNKVLEKFAENYNLKIIFGDENNMARRYLKVIKEHKTNNFIRMTADNPFFCFKKLRKLCEYHKKNKNIYTFNEDLCIGTSFDIVNKSFINLIYRKNYKYSAYLTHYAEILRKNNNKIKKYKIKSKNEFKKYRLTLDTTKDLKMMNYLLFKKDFNSKNFNLDATLKFLNTTKIPNYINNVYVKPKNNDKFLKKIEDEILNN